MRPLRFAATITSLEVLDWPVLLSGVVQSSPTYSDQWRAVNSPEARVKTTKQDKKMKPFHLSLM